MLVDNTFLYNCARNVVLINEFPFIKQLNVQLFNRHVRTGCCGEPKRSTHQADMYNEVKKIIAAMTRDNVDKFKEILNVKQLSVSYTNESGQRCFVEV